MTQKQNVQISKKTISGTELFSKILPKINFSNDSIKIKNGEIVSGKIDKTSFGEEDGELIKELDKMVGGEKTFKIIKNAFGSYEPLEKTQGRRNL